LGQKEIKVMAPKKYIFVNGVMKLNPAFVAATTPADATPPPTSEPTTTTTPATPVVEPLQVISSLDDVVQATDAQSDATGVPMKLADSTVQAIQNTQSDAYVSQFNVGTADGNMVLDGLTEAFIQYEVPIGMINKLHALAAYRLNFIIDDSGSMRYDE
jgi:hypothetical protein